MLKKLIYFFFLLLIVGNVAAQTGNKLKIYGKVTFQGKPLNDAIIELFLYGDKVDRTVTNGNGKFEYFLNLDEVYTLEIYKPTFIKKIMEIDTRNTPPDQAAFGYEYGGWEVALYKDFPELNKTVLEDPVARIEFSEEIQNFEYDIKYTRRIIDKLETLQAKSEQLLEAEDKKLALLQQEYDNLIKEADKAVAKQNYQQAQQFFTQALQMNINNEYPQQKLAEISDVLSMQAKTDEQYNTLIKNADDLFAQKKFNESKQQYQAALQLKPKQEYPQNQIVAADTELNKLLVAQKQAEIEAKQKAENFQSFYASANNFLETGNFEQAQKSVQQALNVIPDNTDAQNLLNEIENNIAAKKAAEEAEKQAALEQKQLAEAKAKQEADDLNRLLSEAIDLKQNGNYTEAIAKFTEAKKYNVNVSNINGQIEEVKNLINQVNQRNQAYLSQLAMVDVLISKKDYKNALQKLNSINTEFPNREQTTAKIDEVNRLVATQNEQQLANEQRINAQNEEKLNLDYLKVLNKANAFYNSKQYQLALMQYQEALKLKPTESLPDQKIIEIKEILSQQLAQKEAEKNIQSKTSVSKINLEEDPDVYTDAFLNEIAKQYPEGVTEKIYTKGNRTITKRVVVKNGVGTVYRKVKHSWGGEYFFKNNDPITKFIWDKETVIN